MSDLRVFDDAKSMPKEGEPYPGGGEKILLGLELQLSCAAATNFESDARRPILPRQKPDSLWDDFKCSRHEPSITCETILDWLIYVVSISSVLIGQFMSRADVRR